MTVSKRLRYEILRRDNHACRYCGATAPDVKLTVDHVTPVALGGSDDAANLVTACADCNSGKTSSNPDQPIVTDVTSDQLRWSVAMKAAAEAQAAKREKEYDFVQYIDQRWLDPLTEYGVDYDRTWHKKDAPERTYDFAVIRFSTDVGLELFDTADEAEEWLSDYLVKRSAPRPSDWENTARTWFAAGIEKGLVADLIELVHKKSNVSDHGRWRYFCGCVWQTLRQRQEIASSLLAKEEADGS